MNTASMTFDMTGPAWKQDVVRGDTVYAGGSVTHTYSDSGYTMCGREVVGVYADQTMNASCRTCTRRVDRGRGR